MKRYVTEIKWALAFVAMQLIWMFLERLLGFHSVRIGAHAIVTNFIAIPSIAVYVLALREKRIKDYTGTMSWVQGLVSGLIITLIVTILSPLVQVIVSRVVTPVYFANAADYAVSQGKMTVDEAARYFSLPNYIVQGLIGTPIMGAITSAVVAVFVKKKGEPEKGA